MFDDSNASVAFHLLRIIYIQFFFNINTAQHQEDLVFVFSVTDIGDKRTFLSLS